MFILKIVAYALVFLISVIGNTLVILVVYLNLHMRTSTNQYLVNLAIADLLVTVCCSWHHLVRHLTHPNYILPGVMCRTEAFMQGNIKSFPLMTRLMHLSRCLRIIITQIDNFDRIILPPSEEVGKGLLPGNLRSRLVLF